MDIAEIYPASVERIKRLDDFFRRRDHVRDNALLFVLYLLLQLFEHRMYKQDTVYYLSLTTQHVIAPCYFRAKFIIALMTTACQQFRTHTKTQFRNFKPFCVKQKSRYRLFRMRLSYPVLSL